MPGQFLSPEGDLEEHFITNHWLIDQYIGDQLWAWGLNSNGQLGDGTTISRSTPVREATSSTNWSQLAKCAPTAFNDHMCAIKSDGTLWCWGSNAYGKLGTNDTAVFGSERRRSIPTQEATSSTNWKFVSKSSYNTFGIKTDGTLWGWGRNNGGQLGLNDIINRSSPCQEFTSSTNWKYVHTDGDSTFAIKTDGTLWGWGNNTAYALGVNDLIRRSIPVQEFSSSTNWKQVSCGPNYNNNSAGAIKTDGTYWAWGQMGSGLDRPTPAPQAIAYTHWKRFVGFSKILSTDGTVYSIPFPFNPFFGTPTQFGYGDGSTDYSTNWKDFSEASQSQSGGIKTDGTLWMWGPNTNGVTGINLNSGTQTTARQEFTLATNWKQIACLGRFTNEGCSTYAIKTGIEMDTGNLTS